MNNTNSGFILDKNGLASFVTLIRLNKDPRSSTGAKQTKTKSDNHKQLNPSSSSKTSVHQRSSSVSSSNNQGGKVYHKLHLHVEGLPVISLDEKKDKGLPQRSTSTVKYNKAQQDESKPSTNVKMAPLSTKSLQAINSKNKGSNFVPDPSCQCASSTSYMVTALTRPPSLSLDVPAVSHQLNYTTPHHSRIIRKQLLSPILGTEEQRSKQVWQSSVRSPTSTIEKKQAPSQGNGESHAKSIAMQSLRL